MGIIRRDRYRRGSHNAISDDSGQKYKRSDMRLTWDGKLVGRDEWEPKQPQLTLRPRPDSPSVKNQTRVENINTFLLNQPFNPGQGVVVGTTTVLDSDLNSFVVLNKMFNSQGNEYTTEFNVLDSDGNSFTVFS